MNIKEFVPFKGAVRRIPKQRPVKYVRGKVTCTCGMIEFYYTTIKAWHLPECIINAPELYKANGKPKKKKKKGRKR